MKLSEKLILCLIIMVFAIIYVLKQQENKINKIRNSLYELPSVGIVCDPYYKTIPEAVLRKQ